jgi:hypothetical protein
MPETSVPQRYVFWFVVMCLLKTSYWCCVGAWCLHMWGPSSSWIATLYSSPFDMVSCHVTGYSSLLLWELKILHMFHGYSLGTVNITNLICMWGGGSFFHFIQAYWVLCISCVVLQVSVVGDFILKQMKEYWMCLRGKFCEVFICGCRQYGQIWYMGIVRSI